MRAFASDVLRPPPHAPLINRALTPNPHCAGRFPHSALARVGWWPEWTVCEDNMMAMLLQRRGYRGYFVDAKVAQGEVRVLCE